MNLNAFISLCTYCIWPLFFYQIQIEDGDTGYSYETIFSPLIDKTLSSVVVVDAYIRSTHQVSNSIDSATMNVLSLKNPIWIHIFIVIMSLDVHEHCS